MVLVVLGLIRKRSILDVAFIKPIEMGVVICVNPHIPCALYTLKLSQAQPWLLAKAPALVPSLRPAWPSLGSAEPGQFHAHSTGSHTWASWKQ